MDQSTLIAFVQLVTSSLNPTRCSAPLLVPAIHLQLILVFASAKMDTNQKTPVIQSNSNVLLPLHFKLKAQLLPQNLESLVELTKKPIVRIFANAELDITLLRPVQS